jgi:hypothetical protein
MKLLTKCLIFLSCSTAVVAGEEPQWLIDARAREGVLGKPVHVESVDKWLSADLPVKVAGKIELSEGSYTLVMNVASDSVISCEVMPDAFDVASLLRLVAEREFKETIPKQHGKVGQKQIEFVRADVYGGVPVLRIDWLYQALSGKETRLGEMKQFATVKADRGIYCEQLDLGYSKTFEAITRALTETLITAAPAPKPIFREVNLLTLRDQRVGYTLFELSRDEAGDFKATETSAMLFQSGPGELRSLDSVSINFANPDGSLINAVKVTVENGEITGNVKLNPAEEDSWLVEGIANGKEVKLPISTGTPDTWLAVTQRRRAMLAAATPVGQKGKGLTWMSEDPGKFNEFATEVTESLGNGKFKMRESVGPMTADLVVDATSGLGLEATMKVGPVEIKLEQVFVEGSF